MKGSRIADQFVVRFPAGLRDEVRQSAARNLRSMNSEIVYLLRKAIQEATETKEAPARS